MSGTLTHSPADIIRYLMIDFALGTIPSDGGAWPIFVGQEPNNPDDVITIFDTAGIHDGRLQVGGEVQEHHGFQVRVRAANHVDGWTKINAIDVTLNESVLLDTTTISSQDYTIQSITRKGTIIPLGKEKPDSRRDVFTLNAVTSLVQS